MNRKQLLRLALIVLVVVASLLTQVNATVNAQGFNPSYKINNTVRAGCSATVSATPPTNSAIRTVVTGLNPAHRYQLGVQVSDDISFPYTLADASNRRIMEVFWYSGTNPQSPFNSFTGQSQFFLGVNLRSFTNDNLITSLSYWPPTQNWYVMLGVFDVTGMADPTVGQPPFYSLTVYAYNCGTGAYTLQPGYPFSLGNPNF